MGVATIQPINSPGIKQTLHLNSGLPSELYLQHTVLPEH